jgi:hypothetical protein
MAIEPICAVRLCNKPLDEFGAILLSPGTNYGTVQSVAKVHICKECYKEIVETHGISQ